MLSPHEFLLTIILALITGASAFMANFFFLLLGVMGLLVLATKVLCVYARK